jgi:ribosome-associated protein
MDWQVIENELLFRTSRSSGAGGQHVNKTETKVTVMFHVAQSAGLEPEEKLLIGEKLQSSITEDGYLMLSSQQSRSQLSNKEDAIRRLKARLEKALIPKTRRKATRPSKASIEERLAEKKIRAEKKEMRKKPKL